MAFDLSLPQNCNNEDVLHDTFNLNDSDITGFGVWMSLHTQTLIVVVLAMGPRDDALRALWTLIATSCCLVIAASMQIAFLNFTLLEAILVSEFVWSANIASTIAIALYSRPLGNARLAKLVVSLHSSISTFLTIIMWVYAGKLGPHPECNGLIQVFILVYFKRSATGSGRRIALILSTIIFSAFTSLSLKDLLGWWKCRRSPTIPFSENFPQTPKLEQSMLPRSEMEQSTAGMRRTRTTGRALLLVVVFFLIWTNSVLTTSAITYMAEGSTSSSSNRGFGQILALLLIVPSLLACAKNVSESDREWKRRKEERQKYHTVKDHEDGRSIPTTQMSESVPLFDHISRSNTPDTLHPGSSYHPHV